MQITRTEKNIGEVVINSCQVNLLNRVGQPASNSVIKWLVPSVLIISSNYFSGHNLPFEKEIANFESNTATKIIGETKMK